MPGNPRVSAKTPVDGRTSGQISIGIPSVALSSGSHFRLMISKQRVLDALLGSVTWAVLPEIRAIRKLSIVPAAKHPCFRAVLTSSQFLRAHAALVPEK